MSKRVESKLGVNRNTRRLGSEKPSTEGRPEVGSKEFYEREKEQAKIMQQELQTLTARNEHQRALEVLTNRTKDDVLSQVKYLYKKAGLSDEETQAIALVTYNMGLDPSPGVGHLYAWKQGNQFIVQIGYQGWIFKARQEFEFVYHVRPMTTTERQERGLKDNEIGAICELYEETHAARWRKMGMEPKPIIGAGVVVRNHSAPNGRDIMWVAQKRATVDAVRHLGLGFGPMQISTIEGMEYSVDDDAYIMTTPDENAIEGEFKPANTESANGAHEQPVEVAGEQPDTTPQEAPAVTPENAGRVIAKTMDELRERIQNRAAIHREKTPQSSATISQQEAEQLAQDLDLIFSEALTLTPSQARKVRKDFLNVIFTTTTCKTLELAEKLSLNDWSKDESAAAIEIQMFRGWHRASRETESGDTES